MSATTARPPQLTIVVPTFNERDNVRPLLAGLTRALSGRPVEVLFVDDSRDDTPEVIRQVAADCPLPVRLLHRPPGQRTGGLAGAVVAGMRDTEAPWVLVMDGDLQHPPDAVPDLMDVAGDDDCDVVVASRYRQGGSSGGLASSTRRTLSRMCTGLARRLFPRRMSGCTDPMTGFFAVRREAVDLDRLRPDGFKILLEILVRGEVLRVREVPFQFAARGAGTSKADLGQGLAYLRHLLRLRLKGTPGRVAGFVAIGASGVLPNLLAMALLLRAGVHYLPATVVAGAVAVSWNFALTDTLLFRSRRIGSWWRRYLGYAGFNSLDVVLRLPLMALLVQVLRVPTLWATATCIVAVAALRFVAVDRLLYRAVPRRVPAPGRAAAEPAPMSEPAPRSEPAPIREVVVDAA